MADRARLTSLFALHVELRRIPDAVSEPPLGEIRLQWWREALDEIAADGTPRAHPVVQALAESGAVSASARATLDRLIDARARLFYRPHFSSIEDLNGFLRAAEAPIAALALEDEDDRSIREAAETYALTRFAPQLTPSLAVEAARESLSRHPDHRRALSNLSPENAGKVAFLALTPGYAARPDGGNWPVIKRATLFRTMLTGHF